MADGNNSGGGGMTAIVAIVAILAVALVAYLVFGQGMMGGDTKKIDATIKVDTPTK